MKDRDVYRSLPKPIACTFLDVVNDDHRKEFCNEILGNWKADSIDAPDHQIHGSTINNYLKHAIPEIQEEIYDIPDFVSINRIWSSHNSWNYYFQSSTHFVSIGAVVELNYDDREIVALYGCVQIDFSPKKIHPFSMTLVHQPLEKSESLLGPFSIDRPYFGPYASTFFDISRSRSAMIYTIRERTVTNISETDYTSLLNNLSSLLTPIAYDSLPRLQGDATSDPDGDERWCRPQDLLEFPESCDWLA